MDTAAQNSARESEVAPCVECGSTDILLSERNQAASHQGGGECMKCGHQVYSEVGALPSRDQLVTVWNVRNDIEVLIAAEKVKVAQAEQRIAWLKEKRGPELRLLNESEKETCLMTAEEFIHDEAAGCLTSDDGHGVWATATHRSDVDIDMPRPVWATHVVWYNR